MALLELKLVTESFIRLLKQGLLLTGYWGSNIDNIRVFPDPPHRANKTGLGFYLYHVQENAHFKNMPAPGRDAPPVRFTPMSLNLYYQLSANSDENEGDNAYEEQLMMGVAMKTLHDYPDISDATAINGVTVLPASLQGKDNRFRISLQPVSHTESVHFWTAGQAPMKLSAYYEVSVVFLEPELSRSYAARVLTYGTYVFTESAPRITGSRNRIVFTIPEDTAPRQVTVQPAQATPGSEIELLGTGLGGGTVELLLFNARWQGAAVANAVAWNIRPAGDRLTVTIAQTARLPETLTEPGATVQVLPGMYGAQVSVTRRPPGGSPASAFPSLSNQFPFMVCPRIDYIGPALAAGDPVPPRPAGNLWTVGRRVQVRGYRFTDPALPVPPPPGEELPVQVYLGDQRLAMKRADDPEDLADGQFRITGTDALEVQLPAGLSKVPFRVLVAGAESPPEWISVA